ncbi:unnamed protein product [Polarella glacialis]|uniref:Nicastrin n=1 Tax=Polarella glacialis TaxID=89957 RepID=A0A813IND3_POLGL|nr:unnamed protein product [Polarella glacialis]
MARSALALLFCLVERGTSLNLLQWNPHWECFAQESACKLEAESFLSETLKAQNVDFANLIMLEDDAFSLPTGWQQVGHLCGKDSLALIFNSGRWALGSSSKVGCLAPDDRPYVIQSFVPNKGSGWSEEVVVVGAHAPHRPVVSWDNLRDDLTVVMASSKVERVIVIADTNQEQSVGSASIMEDLGVYTGSVVSSELKNSCCYSGFQDKYIHAFDRVMANFGDMQSTTMLLDPLPGWARSKTMHKPISTRLDWGVPTPLLPSRVVAFILILLISALLLSRCCRICNRR